MTKGKNKSVLLVEDNPANAELATDLLEMAGWKVVQATSAELAIDLEAREPCDLILMDISLPGIDGLEATRQLKHNPRTAGIPVAVLTAQVMPGDREAVLSAGCVGYIAKPIDTRRFAQTVAAFLNHPPKPSKGE